MPGLDGRSVIVTDGGAGGRLVSSVYVSVAGVPVFPARSVATTTKV